MTLWLHEGERYQLDRSKVRVDLDELDQLLTIANDDATNYATTLERALALWRGEPLEGTDYRWAEGEMRSLSATLLDLLERVGRVRLAHGDARGALQTAEQAIALDQLHEPSWRLALQAEHPLGLRESITRRYDDLTRSLDEQLGLEPARDAGDLSATTQAELAALSAHSRYSRAPVKLTYWQRLPTS